MDNINVKIVPDDSVTKKIEKTAKKLEKQYSLKKKDIDAKKIERTKPQIVFNVILDIVSVILVIFSGLMCFSVVKSKLQNTPPSFAGFSVMRISSGSMIASGFNVGDNIAVRGVDTKTLKAGDIIAFYRYSNSYNNFRITSSRLVDSSEIGDTVYVTSFSSLLGFYSDEIVEAAASGSSIIFHEIIAVYEDADGVRWFKTKGSSNGSADTSYVSETMVVGIYTNSAIANAIVAIVSTVSNSASLILMMVLIPIVLIVISQLVDYTRDLRIAVIENEIVRGKRKLNDPFCVKYGIGTNLSNDEKLKVLALAEDSEKVEFVNLLWKGKKPLNIQKHYLERELKLREYEAKAELHNTCEKMMSDGVSMTKIATYYNKELTKIQNKQKIINKKLKVIRANRQKPTLDEFSDGMQSHEDNADFSVIKKSRQELVTGKNSAKKHSRRKLATEEK